jgi:hypothetical protein
MPYKPPTIKDVLKILAEVEKIERPDSDNEGAPINSSAIYNYLPKKGQDIVDEAEKIINNYLLPNGSLNKRAITEMNKHGYRTYLGPDQYEHDKIVGSVEIGEYTLHLGDESTESEDFEDY